MVCDLRPQDLNTAIALRAQGNPMCVQLSSSLVGMLTSQELTAASQCYAPSKRHICGYASPKIVQSKLLTFEVWVAEGSGQKRARDTSRSNIRGTDLIRG